MNDYKRRRLLVNGNNNVNIVNNAVLGAGCRVPVAELSDAALRAAQQALTFYPISTFDKGVGGSTPIPTTLPIQSYQIEEDGTLVVPRCYGARVFKADASGLSEGTSALNMQFVGSLRDKQVEAAKASISCLRAYPHAAILVLPCGFGKTVVGLSIAAELGRKTLVIVHKEFLLEQWRERIAVFLPNVNVGLIQGPRCIVEGCDIVIGMIASLTSERNYECLEAFGTIILDEAHHMAARHFSTIFYRLQSKYVLGLTATPKRKDSCTALLHEHMGAFAYKEDPDPGTALVLRVTYSSPWLKRRNEEISAGEAQRLKTKMTTDKTRNSLIVSWCLKATAAGRRTLLLSDRVQHLRVLREEYESLLPVTPKETHHVTSAVYVGGMKQIERETASRATVIFGSFSLAQEGLDIPDLDTLVLATPVSDVTQAVGRILRACEDKMRAVVVDILDDTCKNFQRLNDMRNFLYRRRAFEVKDNAADDYLALSE